MKALFASDVFWLTLVSAFVLACLVLVITTGQAMYLFPAILVGSLCGTPLIRDVISESSHKSFSARGAKPSPPTKNGTKNQMPLIDFPDSLLKALPPERRFSLVEQEAFQHDENHYKRLFVSDVYRLLVFYDNNRDSVRGFQIYGETPPKFAGSPEIINCHLDDDGHWRVGHSGKFSYQRFYPVAWTIGDGFILSFRERAANLEKSLIELIITQLESLRGK